MNLHLTNIFQGINCHNVCSETLIRCSLWGPEKELWIQKTIGVGGIYKITFVGTTEINFDVGKQFHELTEPYNMRSNYRIENKT
jgi:hypothetical protein